MHWDLSQTFSYIPKMSSIKALGMEDFFFLFGYTKSQWKRHNPRTLNLAPPSFQEDLQIICSLYLTYIRLRMDIQ